MTNKELIAYLQQFDPDLEVWLFDNRHFEEWQPGIPSVHFEHIEHTLDEKKEFICIPFASRINGN